MQLRHGQSLPKYIYINLYRFMNSIIPLEDGSKVNLFQGIFYLAGLYYIITDLANSARHHVGRSGTKLVCKHTDNLIKQCSLYAPVNTAQFNPLMIATGCMGL